MDDALTAESLCPFGMVADIIAVRQHHVSYAAERLCQGLDNQRQCCLPLASCCALARHPWSEHPTSRPEVAWRGPGDSVASPS